MDSALGANFRSLADLPGADPMNAPAGTAVIGTKGDNWDINRPVCSGLRLGKVQSRGSIGRTCLSRAPKLDRLEGMGVGGR